MKNLLLKFQKGYPRASEVCRFLLVGGLATLIDMLVMAMVIFIPNHSLFNNNVIDFFLFSNNRAGVLWVVLGTMLGFCVGLVVNYVLSYKFVYVGENKKAKTKKGFLLFLLLSACGLGIQTLGMFLGYGILHLNEWFVKIVLVIIVLAFNYITRKLFIFNDNPVQKPEPVEFDDKDRKIIELWAFALLFAIYFFVAYMFMFRLPYVKQGFFFSADSLRVFNDWNVFNEDHSRTKVHPLYVLFIYPIFAILKLLGANAYFACVLFCSVVATINTFLVYKILYKLANGKNLLAVVLCTAFFAFAFTVLDNLFKTESFAIGALTLLAFWCWFVYNREKKLGMKDYVILSLLGLFTFSMTITNFIQFLIGLAFLFVFKKFETAKQFFKSIGIMCAIVLSSLLTAYVLMVIQSAIFVTAENAIDYAFKMFAKLLGGVGEVEDTTYMSSRFDKDIVIHILQHYFGFAFAGCDVVVISGNYLWAAASRISDFVMKCNIVIFIVGSVKVIIEKKWQYVPFILLFVFECVFHIFYGVGTLMLYLPHAAFVLPILMLECLNWKNKKVNIVAFAGIFALFGLSTIHSLLSVVDAFSNAYMIYGATKAIAIVNSGNLFLYSAFIFAIVVSGIKIIESIRFGSLIGVEEKERKRKWVLALAGCMLFVILCGAGLSAIERAKQERLRKAPPELILMGMGQREKYYFEKNEKEYVFYRYDPQTKESVVVIDKISNISFDSENYIVKIHNKKK